MKAHFAFESLPVFVEQYPSPRMSVHLSPPPAFVTPFLLPSSHTPSRRLSSAPTRSYPKKRARLRCHFGPPSVPEVITELDRLEFLRRENLSVRRNLPPDVKARLFREIPELADLEARMEKEMALPDYDPDDPRVYSWAYEKLRPWAPGPLLIFLATSLPVYAVRRAHTIIRSHPTPITLALLLTRIDTILTLVLCVFLPIIVAALILRVRNRVQVDGARRVLAMYAPTTLLLPSAAAMAATANATPALLVGVMARVCMAMSLWFWQDLREEVCVGNAPGMRFLRLWRALLTFTVLIPGVLWRLLGLIAPNYLPLYDAVAGGAAKGRLWLGKSFPVSFSLCNDPRGLFLAGSLVALVAIAYLMYLIVFVSDFFNIREHRNSTSFFSQAMCAVGFYQPNVHPNDIIGKLSAPPATTSFLPSPAMMLRQNDDVFNDSSLLSNEAAMPILAFLDKEEEIMANEGVTTWLPPRFEQVPLSDNLTREKRSKDALYTWARPMSKKEAEMSFEEYFDTLDDDEYTYDQETGNWVFKNAGVLSEPNLNYDSTVDVSEIDINNIPDGVGAVAFDVPPELQPWLERFINESDLDDEEEDGPTVPVYV